MFWLYLELIEDTGGLNKRSPWISYEDYLSDSSHTYIHIVSGNKKYNNVTLVFALTTFDNADFSKYLTFLPLLPSRLFPPGTNLCGACLMQVDLWSAGGDRAFPCSVVVNLLEELLILMLISKHKMHLNYYCLISNLWLVMMILSVVFLSLRRNKFCRN